MWETGSSDIFFLSDAGEPDRVGAGRAIPTKTYTRQSYTHTHTTEKKSNKRNIYIYRKIDSYNASIFVENGGVRVDRSNPVSCPVVMQTDRIQRGFYRSMVANIPMALCSFTIAASLSL